MTEIEIRGKLSKENFNKLKSLLEKDAILKDHYKRLSIDLSPGFDPKTRSWKNSKFDLRLKKSGTSEKISLKIGKFHLKEREEIDVKLEEGQFLDALKLLETLGFNKGMIYFWESWEFGYKGYEIKLSQYNDDYYTWEIESHDPKKDPSSLAQTFSLIPYTEKDYKETIDWENKNIHKLYSYDLTKKLLKDI